MPKRIFSILLLTAILIVGLLVWNIYLIDEVKELRETEEDLNLKNQMLEGDNDVLSYDLVTCRDSLRILNDSVK